MLSVGCATQRRREFVCFSGSFEKERRRRKKKHRKRRFRRNAAHVAIKKKKFQNLCSVTADQKSGRWTNATGNGRRPPLSRLTSSSPTRRDERYHPIRAASTHTHTHTERVTYYFTGGVKGRSRALRSAASS